VRIVQVFPELLGTYGDGGNGLVLRERAGRRGIDVELIRAGMDDPLPAGDVYLLGGGEDGPQRLAVALLVEAGFSRRVADGAMVFAVCAGLQMLGSRFSVQGDDEYVGLGLVDAVTTRAATRAVGDLVTTVEGTVMVGFENHGGETRIGAGVKPFATVVRGRGNDGLVDGFRDGRIWATYAHGPVLALNPWLADAVLAESLGLSELAPLQSVADRLYESRCRVLTSRAVD
jgi:CobQ-like glutamine amidotransferase family enzyme